MKETVETAIATRIDNSSSSVYGISDVGCVRENNEDSIYYDPPESMNHNMRNDYMMAIADGMGGHNGGEVASKCAVDHLRSARPGFGNELHGSLVKAFVEASRKIYHIAQQDASLRGMGTTCTALLINGQYAYCAHVGDSRVYLIRNSAIYRMTEDHTVLAESGKNHENETSRNDPAFESSLLTRALGTFPSIKVDTWKHGLPIQKNDNFVLCTDGLSDLVQDEEIKHIIMSFPLDEACHRLVKMAKNRGGHDNISIVATSILRHLFRELPCHLKQT
jgi:protein phosphatase